MKFNYIQLFLFFCLLSVFTACETINEANLIGEWEVVSMQDEDGNEMPWKSPIIWEFTKDYKVYSNAKQFGEWSRKEKDITVSAELYDSSGNHLGTQVMTIAKLTSTTLIIEDPSLHMSNTAGPALQKVTFKRIK